MRQAQIRNSMNYTTLPILKSNMVILSGILRHLAVLFINRARRDQAKVSNDYDEGLWEKVLTEKRWTKCESILDYVVGNDDHYRIAKINDCLVRIRTDDYYAFRLQTLQEVVSKYADVDELWELGCGCGLNLFSLSLANHWKHLFGLDISKNATEAGRQAAKHFGLDNINFGTIDLLNSDDPNFDKLRDKTVFTYHCLEQLKYSTETVINNIRSAGVKRVIHFEPTTELLRFWSLKDIANYVYIARMDYQNNLLKTLWKFQDKGLLKIVEQKRMYFAPTPRHDHTLVVWETCS